MTNDRSVYIVIDQWQNVNLPFIGNSYGMPSLFISHYKLLHLKERLLIIPEEENEHDILDNKTKRCSINKVESKKLDTIVEISTSTNDSTSIVHKVQTHSVPVNLQGFNEKSQEEDFSTSNGTDCKSYEMKTFTSCSSNPSQTISENNKIPISAL